MNENMDFMFIPANNEEDITTVEVSQQEAWDKLGQHTSYINLPTSNEFAPSHRLHIEGENGNNAPINIRASIVFNHGITLRGNVLLLRKPHISKKEKTGETVTTYMKLEENVKEKVLALNTP